MANGKFGLKSLPYVSFDEQLAAAGHDPHFAGDGLSALAPFL
jgi:hypothetical protein